MNIIYSATNAKTSCVHSSFEFICRCFSHLIHPLNHTETTLWMLKVISKVCINSNLLSLVWIWNWRRIRALICSLAPPQYLSGQAWIWSFLCKPSAWRNCESLGKSKTNRARTAAFDIKRVQVSSEISRSSSTHSRRVKSIALQAIIIDYNRGNYLVRAVVAPN